MSYLDRRTNPRQRSTAVAAVAVIHALLAYAVLTGLIQHMGPRHRDIFRGYFDSSPPPPPSQPEPKQQERPKKTEEKVTVPPTTTDLTNDRVQVEIMHGDVITDNPPKPEIIEPPLPPPPPHFTPREASPRNNPGAWAVTDDYPPRDLHEENEGVTGFRVTVGTNGRVTGCEIVRSSGHPGLDAATCKAVTARARFAPATDENGDAVSGSYSNSVRWEIPR